LDQSKSIRIPQPHAFYLLLYTLSQLILVGAEVTNDHDRISFSDHFIAYARQQHNSNAMFYDFTIRGKDDGTVRANKGRN
jgi:hypothetical protein